MKRILFLLIAVSLVFVSCASAPKKEEKKQEKKSEISENVKKEATESAEDKYDKMLVEAGNLLRAGKIEEAVKNKIDPVIAYFEEKYKDSEKDIYCARDKTEMMTYLMVAAAKKTNSAIVLYSTWADALFYKAYVLVEFKKYDEAKVLLERSIELSPYNSSYLSELGHIYQIEKSWEKSLEIFESAVKYAKEFTPEPLKQAELTRAMRGIGYTLIEMGKLDEAEKFYVECLKINKNDRAAVQELMYIKKLRESQKSEEPQGSKE